MLPSRYIQPAPTKSKRKPTGGLKHIAAPLKGLSLSSAKTASNTDPLTATVLDNFVIEEDKITCRPGSRKAYTHAAAKPIEALITHYGAAAHRLAAASNGELRLLDNTLIHGGFTSNDWHWTAFSNLSATEYVVMVNGRDGVWSWDGDLTSTNPPAVAVTNLSKGFPAVCTVAAGDIAKFGNGMVVTIAGAVGDGLVNANGPQVIYSVNVPANTFTLANVDTSAAAAAQTTGVTADPPGTGIIQEVITAPAWLPHINPLQFDIVLSHQNRLWFADKSNLSVYYLPLQQKSGMVSELPLNAIFKKGGFVRALATWTSDGGTNMDDQLVVFSSNGECAIYGGTDPDSDFGLVGVYSFDAPMSKHSVVRYGGELHVLVSTGFLPMSTLMKAESETLGKYDQNVFSLFQKRSLYRSFPGWSAFINPDTGRAICNAPGGSPNNYGQLVRAMQAPTWVTWSGLHARCWGWANNLVYYGSDDGKVYELDLKYLSDEGVPIRVGLQMAWQAYGSSQQKQFTMVLPYIISSGVPKPFLDMVVDYKVDVPLAQPDVTTATTGALWDTATWDVDYWAGAPTLWNNWQGVSGLGRVGAIRLVAEVINCEFSVAGFDVLYENGSIFG